MEALMTRFAAVLVGLFFGLVSQASLATNYTDWWADAAYGGSSMNISLPIVGIYRYADKIVNSECTVPANNSTNYLTGILVITTTPATSSDRGRRYMQFGGRA
jgi:hypothetical protein